VTAVAKLVDRGFRATRIDDGKERECACSIVAEALADFGIELTYHAVAKIWIEKGYLVRMPQIIRLKDFRLETNRVV